MNINDHTNPYKFTLDIFLPTGKATKFQKIVSPLIRWIDPSFQLIRTFDDGRPPSEGLCKVDRKHNDRHRVPLGHKGKTEPETLPVPSMTVMLFLHEQGTMCAANVQQFLKRKPWKFHHKVELHNRKMLNRPVAAQEFYSLADDLPLWSVCPIHCGNEHFRVLLHVRDFQKMMEFYRLITDVEIETSKPGFCVFQLYSQPGLDTQLALKVSENIDPRPIDNTVLNFQVKNIETIRSYLKCDCSTLGYNRIALRDPDGNLVILTECNSFDSTEFDEDLLTSAIPRDNKGLSNTSAQNNGGTHGNDSNERNNIVSKCELIINSCQKYSEGTKRSLEDVKSFRSSDSHDSGRCSDSDIWSSEVDQLKPDKNIDSEDKTQDTGGGWKSISQCHDSDSCERPCRPDLHNKCLCSKVEPHATHNRSYDIPSNSYRGDRNDGCISKNEKNQECIGRRNANNRRDHNYKVENVKSERGQSSRGQLDTYDRTSKYEISTGSTGNTRSSDFKRQTSSVESGIQVLPYGTYHSDCNIISKWAVKPVYL